MAKPKGPHVPKLDKALVRSEAVIRADLRAQFEEIVMKWQLHRRKDLFSNILGEDISHG